MCGYGRDKSRLNTDRLGDLRRRMREDATGDALINDLVRFPPAAGEAIPERSFRVLAAHRTPDAILFQRTIDPDMPGRVYPSGLDVAVLLGSEFARARVEYADRERLLAEIDRARRLLGEGALYIQYLRCDNWLATWPPASGRYRPTCSTPHCSPAHRSSASGAGSTIFACNWRSSHTSNCGARH